MHDVKYDEILKIKKYKNIKRLEKIEKTKITNKLYNYKKKCYNYIYNNLERSNKNENFYIS